MQLRKKLPVVATLLSLGGLTGVAMNAGGGRKRDQSAVAVADTRTVTMQQTVHRYKHVGIGGPANGSWPVGGGVAAVGQRIAVAVHTRASGAKATPKALSLRRALQREIRPKRDSSHGRQAPTRRQRAQRDPDDPLERVVERVEKPRLRRRRQQPASWEQPNNQAERQ